MQNNASSLCFHAIYLTEEEEEEEVPEALASGVA